MKAEEIDKKFDDGEDVLEYFDTDKPLRPNLEARRVNIDFTAWMVNKLDKEFNTMDISWQALIKIRIINRIRHSDQ